MRFHIALVAIAISASTCTRTPPSSTTPAPAPDASSPAADACRNLGHAGCAFGDDPLCPSRVELGVSEHHLEAKDVACAAAAAPTQDALTHCSPFFACTP